VHHAVSDKEEGRGGILRSGAEGAASWRGNRFIHEEAERKGEGPCGEASVEEKDEEANADAMTSGGSAMETSSHAAVNTGGREEEKEGYGVFISESGDGRSSGRGSSNNTKSTRGSQ